MKIEVQPTSRGTTMQIICNVTQWHTVYTSVFQHHTVAHCEPQSQVAMSGALEHHGYHYIIVERLSKVLPTIEIVSKPVCWVEWAVNVGGQTTHSVLCQI